MASLLHNFHYAVEIDRMLAVGEGRIQIGVESTRCRVSIALDAGYLHQTAHRVARKSEMMLKTHFRRILYLCGGAAEQLRCRSGSHGARHAYLALAPYLGTRNRRVLLHDIAEKTGRGKRTEYALLAEALRRVQMVQHRLALCRMSRR